MAHIDGSRRALTSCCGMSWPLVAIPRRPGWGRHLINGKQIDRPTRQAPATGEAL